MILEIFVILKGLTDFGDFGMDFHDFDDLEQIFVIYNMLVLILMIWIDYGSESSTMMTAYDAETSFSTEANAYVSKPRPRNARLKLSEAQADQKPRRSWRETSPRRRCIADAVRGPLLTDASRLWRMTGTIIRQQHGRVWRNMVPQPPSKCKSVQAFRSCQIEDIVM